MNITYLFGAGASRSAIPVVNELVKSMRQEMEQIAFAPPSFKNEIFQNTPNPYITPKLLEDLVNDLQWVTALSSNHLSIDTFAKKLYIQDETEKLKVLKTILSLYLVIIQSKNKVDIRYDGFFASILAETIHSFPPNLKILSWNYDYQFEKAYSEYSGDTRLDSCSSLLNIYSKHSNNQTFQPDKFGIIKLNGTAAFMFNKAGLNTVNYCQNVNAKYDAALIHSLLENYASLHHISSSRNKYMPSLSFAWEGYSHGKFIVDKAVEFTKQTDILVIIGYSFPLFNRLVDRDIVRAMSNLQKVYFQAPDADALKERFLAIRDDIRDDCLIIRRDVDQFIFPNEF